MASASAGRSSRKAKVRLTSSKKSKTSKEAKLPNKRLAKVSSPRKTAQLSFLN